MKNIIQNSRIISNYTFATRFVNFLKDVEVSDPMIDEELDYMRRVANSLLELQIDTATDYYERDYLMRCHKGVNLRINSTKMIDLKAGDCIVILDDNGTDRKSKYFVKGAKFKVVSSKIRTKFKRNRFYNCMTLKYGKDYDYDFNNFQLFLNDCIEFHEPVVQEVTVKLPNNTKYAVRSDLYSYGVVPNGL